MSQTGPITGLTTDGRVLPWGHPSGVRRGEMGKTQMAKAAGTFIAAVLSIRFRAEPRVNFNSLLDFYIISI